MPKPMYPKKGEEKDTYISRCISSLIKEGKTREQAAGQCFGMWRSKGKKGVRGGDRGELRRRQLALLNK